MRAAVLLLVALFAMAGAPAALAEAPKIGEEQAIEAARRDPKVREEKREHPELAPGAAMKEGHWEVAWFSRGDELALVVVDAHSGRVTESWTGYQVLWKMARGYSGAFGHELNAPYVFLPLCLIFLIGLVDWRRLRRVANLDLLVLLGFGVSHYFFNRAEIGLSAPLVYPVLLYLLGRCLWIGLRGRGEGLRPVWPAAAMLIAALFLLGFRVGLNIVDSGVIDVGYAGVVGADKIAHGEPIYDNLPGEISDGDTYGPVNYLAYLPFERIWPWSGSWDDLPAAHAASVIFDTLVFALLVAFGFQIRPGPAGERLAATLAFGWAAYPYSAYALESNSNDTLVGLLLLAALLVAARPLARGVFFALATWSKFAPAVLGPMLLTYRSQEDVSPKPKLARVAGRTGVFARSLRGRRLLLPDRTRAPVTFVAGFLLVTVAVLLWPAIDPGLRTFYDRTVGIQAGRESPFSIWGQAPSLEPLRVGLLVLTGALSLAFAFVPRRKSLVQLAALAAALLILLEITLHHWFYLYIVWFFPLLLAALTLPETSPPTSPEAAREPSPARRSRPARAG